MRSVLNHVLFWVSIILFSVHKRPQNTTTDANHCIVRTRALSTAQQCAERDASRARRLLLNHSSCSTQNPKPTAPRGPGGKGRCPPPFRADVPRRSTTEYSVSHSQATSPSHSRRSLLPRQALPQPSGPIGVSARAPCGVVCTGPAAPAAHGDGTSRTRPQTQQPCS